HSQSAGDPPGRRWRWRRIHRPRIRRRCDDPPEGVGHPLPAARSRRALADAVASQSRSGPAEMKTRRPLRGEGAESLIMALPNGRILGEVMPLLHRLGIDPEPAFGDPKSRKLRFATSDPALDLIRVRSFDVATFVAFGAAQLGVAGNDVLMEFDYSEIYAPLDLDIGHCHVAVAAPSGWAGQE